MASTLLSTVYSCGYGRMRVPAARAYLGGCNQEFLPLGCRPACASPCRTVPARRARHGIAARHFASNRAQRHHVLEERSD